MIMRTSQKTVTFMHPFSLRGVDGIQPAGTYTVDTDEELLEALSFPVYRRVTTSMFLPSQPGGMISGQVATVDPAELEAAQERDAMPDQMDIAESRVSGCAEHPSWRRG